MTHTTPPKIATALALCLALACLARAAAAAPAGLAAAPAAGEVGEWRRSLDGPWRFTTDPSKDESAWHELAVPGNWDTLNEFAHFVGKGWYRRYFDVPADWKSKRIRIRFEAVYETAEVWLNGTRLGVHSGGYTPFEFDVTDVVKIGQPNRLSVSADNRYRRGAWWAWGGISRSVDLVANNDVRVVTQHVRAEPDLAAGTAKVFVKLSLWNGSDRAVDAVVAGAIEGAAGATFTARANLPPRQFTKVDANVSLPKQDVRLWHFDHPNLYRVTTRVTTDAGGTPLHAKTDRFGIRKIDVKPDGLYLNGERVRLNGFNRVHEHRALGNTEPDHLVKSDVDLMKRYGCNLTRLMHAPLAPNLLDYLDEQGVMIFEEVPLWGGEDPRMNPHDRLAFQWLREMIDRDYNHPCVIGWSVGNELLQHKAYVTSAYDYVRAELDPHRLLSYVSHSGHKSTYTAANDPISQSDLVLHNCYKSWYPRPSITTKTIRGKWPALPIFYTEYGTKTFGDTLDEVVPSLDEWYHDLAGHPYVIGTSLWTFADYRSKWKGTLPSENRGWGMFDVWRRPKAAVAQVDALYSPVRSLTVQGGQIRLEPRTWDDIPAFTLHDYWLRWEWLGADGFVAGGGVVRLPKIEPGSATRTTPIGAAPAADAELVVSLITPTGHVVAEQRQRPTGASAAAAPAIAGRAAKATASEMAAAYPIDGGFVLGYVNEKDDKGVIVEYGTTSGKYAERLTANLRGAIAVRGLENGRTYFARLRRIPVTGEADWSDEVSVIPDGGLKPAAPVLYGVVRGEGVAAVRFQPIEKAIGYVVRYGDQTVRVNTAAVGAAVITGLADASAYTFTVTALNAAGESPASNAVVSAPRAESAD